MRALAGRLFSFINNYSDLFKVLRHDVSAQANCYIAGLMMKASRKNMERMVEYVPESDYQSQQQFLSDSPWNHTRVLNRIAQDTNKILGGSDSVFIIDESCFEKKGVKSVGVDRQWNGRLGKVDNSQVGVYAGISDGKGCGLVNVRLFLPESWTSDPSRCDEAKIPQDKRQAHTKIDLAQQMIEDALEQKLDFGWVALDALYGSSPQLLRYIDEHAKKFVADVRSNQHIYATMPKPYLPRRSKNKGRKYTQRQVREKSLEISDFFDSVEPKQWKTVKVREGVKGTIIVSAVRKRVWLWDGKQKQPRCWWAVCYIDADKGEPKYFLSNASERTSLALLVRKHATRYWIERAFQDAKTSTGMADYQARGWVAWHHHMTMVILAQLFMLQERRLNFKEIKLLSCQDIVELLNFYLPRADNTQEQILKNLRRRHQQRQEDIDRARKKVIKPPKPPIPKPTK